MLDHVVLFDEALLVSELPRLKARLEMLEQGRSESTLAAWRWLEGVKPHIRAVLAVRRVAKDVDRADAMAAKMAYRWRRLRRWASFVCHVLRLLR